MKSNVGLNYHGTIMRITNRNFKHGVWYYKTE